MQPLNLVWLRNDLRSFDNAALSAAVENSKETGAALLVLFIATPVTWQLHDMAPIKQDLIRRRVTAMVQELSALGITMIACEGSSYQRVPEIFNELAAHYTLTVYAQTEYELRERARDDAVRQLVQQQGGQMVLFDTQCIMPPGSIRTLQGDIYKVFTPFKRSWLARLQQQPVHCLSRPKLADWPDIKPLSHEPMRSGDNSSDAWPVAEQDVLNNMREFCQSKVASYEQLRDYPAIDGTSQLSPYLAIGVLSAAQCVARLQLEAAEEWSREKSGAAVWMSELIWREFYKHILVAFPDLIKHRPFQKDTDKIAWRNDKQLFAAWCEGRTGYPIVDAAMRQLNQTGWMHNRLRMITASFLVKDLHIDWRWGERYFMSKLIDGDFAANNGGWQWAASTGTDAAPYFRIFNPVTQSEKFDPKGEFLRLYLPELKLLSGKALHWPHSSAGKHYVAPVVEHAKAREITLALFSEVKHAV